MSSITTTTRDFGSCLACGKPLIAIIEVRVTDIHLDEAVGTANVEVVGTSVSHDCLTTQETTDEWVEVDNWFGLPEGARVRQDLVLGVYDGGRCFVHRDDLSTTEAPGGIHDDDEWVEVDEWSGLRDGARLRMDWASGAIGKARRFVHRDDLTADAAPTQAGTEAAFKISFADADSVLAAADAESPTVTERDRTPDPIATIKPFRHPWISGTERCEECGEKFHDHWWVDAEDHGHTVCRLPNDEWVEVDNWYVLPEGTRVRSEWALGVSGEGRRFAHRDDLPDHDEGEK